MSYITRATGVAALVTATMIGVACAGVTPAVAPVVAPSSAPVLGRPVTVMSGLAPAMYFPISSSCGPSHDGSRSTATMEVDVLIDSLAGSQMDRLTAVVSALPDELKRSGEPVIVSELYWMPPRGDDIRVSSARCSLGDGTTFRVNGARVRGVLVSVAAGGPVLFTVRGADGAMLGKPLTLVPGDSAHVMAWLP